MRSKKIIINIVLSLLLQVVTVICGLIVPRLIIGTFGSAVNGLISSITQFLGYITLLEAGVGPVVKSVLYKPIANNDKNKIETILKESERFFKKISYIFLIYIIILCAFFSTIMKSEFNMCFTISLVLIIAISTFAEYFFGMTYRLYLQAEQKTYIISTIQIITYILNTIIIILLIKFNCNIQLVKLFSAGIFVLRPILQNIYVKKKYNLNCRETKSQYQLKQKWDGLAQHIAAVIHNNTDIVILTIFSNIKEVSVYTVYLSIINGIKNLILSFSTGVDASFGDMIAKEEKNHLTKSFNIYEIFYYMISTIVFSCTLLLIIPFIKVYTKGINDADYIVPVFAYLMVIAEFIWSIRQPYNELIKAAGHFKQTRIGAWIEALSNLIISVILVIRYGIIGVAIGTLISIIMRTIEFIIHTSKYILERSPWIALQRISLSIIQILLIVFISNLLPRFENTTYISWILYAMQIAIITVVVVSVSSLIVYREDKQDIIELVKGYIKK